MRLNLNDKGFISDADTLVMNHQTHCWSGTMSERGVDSVPVDSFGCEIEQFKLKFFFDKIAVTINAHAIIIAARKTIKLDIKQIACCIIKGLKRVSF